MVAPGRPRVYEVFPGFRFQRLGRGEGARFPCLLRFVNHRMDRPLWMHCGIKSDRDYLVRSERTNWRELGDYRSFPRLEDYLRRAIRKKYGTDDIDQAAERFMSGHMFPFLRRYDPIRYHEYPDLVKRQMESRPVYRVLERDGRLSRERVGDAALRTTE